MSNAEIDYVHRLLRFALARILLYSRTAPARRACETAHRKERLTAETITRGGQRNTSVGRVVIARPQVC